MTALIPHSRLLLLALLPVAVCQAAGGELIITASGAPKAAVVLADGIRAKDPAASALISHIKQMSGATLPVVTAKELAGARIEGGNIIAPAGVTEVRTFILLGESELARRMGFTLDGLGAGGIVVETKGNAIALLAKDDGSDSRSPASARPVFRLLEALGCRSLWPGETGKVVPKRESINVGELSVRFTPPIGQRRIRFVGPDARDSAKGLASLGLSVDDYRAALDAASRNDAEGNWAAWNGLGGNIGIVGGAAGCGLRGGWAEHGASHPEWFALQADGTRDQSKAKERWRLCVSNPDLIEHVAGDIIRRLNGHAQSAISLCPNDGGYSSFCMCEACKRLDPPEAPKVKMLVFAHVGGSERTEIDHPSLTDRFVHYWNAVAERVTKVVPDQLFLVEAYSYYSDPPVRERLHPNLVVRYVPTTTEGWKGWDAAGAKRLYWRPNNLHSGHRDGVLSPKARETADALNYLAAHGILATDMDTLYHHWATHGLHYYAAARLSWDPRQSFDALLDDYCTSGFGAGATQVKQYFLLAEKGVIPVKIGNRGAFPQITPETITELRALLVAAGKATQNDAPAHRRVAFLRAGLEFTAVSAEAHRLADAVDGGAKLDPAVANAVMERRWQLMRALFKSQPLAVNLGIVASNDTLLIRSLKWNGPSDAAKSNSLSLGPDDDWLNEDQSATRR